MTKIIFENSEMYELRRKLGDTIVDDKTGNLLTDYAKIHPNTNKPKY